MQRLLLFWNLSYCPRIWTLYFHQKIRHLVREFSIGMGRKSSLILIRRTAYTFRILPLVVMSAWLVGSDTLKLRLVRQLA